MVLNVCVKCNYDRLRINKALVVNTTGITFVVIAEKECHGENNQKYKLSVVFYTVNTEICDLMTTAAVKLCTGSIAPRRTTLWPRLCPAW